MKRLSPFFFSLLLLLPSLLLLPGCQGPGKGLDEVYQPAYSACVDLIPELFPDKVINTNTVSVRYLKEAEKSAVVLLDAQDPSRYFTEHGERFWVFLIGNASGFEYVQMVCSSSTDAVIGYLPMD